MSLQLAALVAACSGLLALSSEILWYRLISFLTGGTSAAFGVLLGAYLLGLAFGSLWVRRACPDGQPTPQQLRLPAALALGATLASWAVVPLAARLVAFAPWPLLLPVVALAAGLQGAILPLAAHFGIAPDHRAGARLSWVYLANIAGSTLGSLLTGFWLLDVMTLAQVTTLLAVLGALLALLLAWAVPGVLAAARRNLTLVALTCGVAVVALQGLAFDQLWERLQLKQRWRGEAFAHVIETRSGVITVNQNGGIYGGGVYDGVFHIDLVDDRNRILRPFMVAAMHPSPKRILVIGLASGSWTQVLVNLPGVEHVTAIEINPGYLELIRRFAQVQSLLGNPKLEVVVDDGRRWLEAHPDAKFDVVVQNTSFHWRGHATNLLSTAYLDLVRRHLAPGGQFLWNTTDSIHAQKAGCQVFAHALRFDNHMAGSDAPIRLDAGQFRERVLAMRIDGKAVLDPSIPTHAKRLGELETLLQTKPEGRSAYFEGCPSILEKCKDGPPVTEDNMVSEFARPWWATPP